MGKVIQNNYLLGNQTLIYYIFRRICPGIYLAETEIFLAFVQTFARCYIEPSTDGLLDIDSAVNLGLTTAPISYKVKFVKRADSPI